MIKKSWIFLLVFWVFTVHSQEDVIKTGPWRFELKATHATIPFIIEFEFNKNRLSGSLYNGKETIKLGDIIYRGKQLSIPVPPYEITMELRVESPTLLTGMLIRHNKNPKIETPLKGVYGETQRLIVPQTDAKVNLNGRWALMLKNEDGSEVTGVGVFEQKGRNFSGSILTPTGDYRYLEGQVFGDEFEAASFDGMFNYLFKGKIENGKLHAGLLSNYLTKITGTSDSKADLPDATKVTQLNSLNFSFPDLKGKKVSLSDPEFKGRPVIVVFFGSWCPNCIDEMNFMIPWYNANKKRGIKVISLSFERSLSLMDAKRQLNKIQKKYNVPYPLLLAGATAEDKPMDKISGLKNFASFPTTVFLNKKHEVVKIHSGFTGPSTGVFYDNWKKEFDVTVSELLK